jgi:hypothetical protein
MKKETVVAIIFGILFGSVFSFFFINSKKEQSQSTNLPANLATTIPEKKVTQISTQNLEINMPENNSISDKKQVVIKGKAPKKSLMVIQSPIKDIIFENENESFTIDFPLAYGANQISIFSYPKNSPIPMFKNLTIYYLENKL